MKGMEGMGKKSDTGWKGLKGFNQNPSETCLLEIVASQSAVPIVALISP
jgi:hypothetical protein